MVKRIEDEIQRAIEEGQFENLPGKGKPIAWDENPFEDPEWRLANSILRQNGYSLPWIETHREIGEDLEAARKALVLAWNERISAAKSVQDLKRADERWGRATEAFRKKIEAVNKRIFNYNLEVPSDRFQRRKIDADREIENLIR
ncbi:MAG: DUF1992 domain-containing protein [Chloroflexota bacterium]|nr:MAG: DUF1992 domain-containing protein [Chloroflexota bacterium]